MVVGSGGGGVGGGGRGVFIICSQVREHFQTTQIRFYYHLLKPISKQQVDLM